MRRIRRIVIGISRGAVVGVILAALWAEYATADWLHRRSALRDLTERSDVATLIGIVFAGVFVGFWRGLWESAPGTRSPLRWVGRVFVGGVLAGVLIWATYCTFSPACRYAVYGLFNGEPRHNGLCRSFWIRELKSTESYRREKAVEVLDKLEQGAEPAMPALREALNDPEKNVRRAAAKALRHAPVGDPETIAALKSLLDDPDSDLRRYAQESLIHSVLSGQLEPLMAMLDHQYRGIQWEAATALGRMGRDALPAVPKLLPLLEQSLISPDKPLLDALVSIGKAAPAEFADRVRDYLRLDRPDDDRVKPFAYASALMKGVERPFIPLLIGLLSDSDAKVRRNAAWCLGAEQSKDNNVWLALEKLCQEDPNDSVRKAAAQAGGQIMRAVDAENAKIAKAAAEAKVEAEARTKAAAEVEARLASYRQNPNRLEEQLRATDPTQRIEACNLVWQLRTPQEAVKFLAPLIQDADVDVRKAVVHAFIWKADVPPKDKVQLLTPFLKDSNADIRREAVLALAQRGVASDAIVEVFDERLSNSEWYIRRDAAEELGKLGPAARPAVPALVRLLGDSNSQVQRAAAVALWQIEGTDNENVMRPIRKKDSAFLIDALASLRPAPVNTIAAGLESEDSYTRERAAEALGSLGPDAKATVPALLNAMTRADSYKRKPFADAIDQIEAGKGTRTLLWLWWEWCLSEAALVGVALAAAFLLVRWVGLVIFRAIWPAPRQPVPKSVNSGYNPFADSHAAESGESGPASHQS